MTAPAELDNTRYASREAYLHAVEEQRRDHVRRAKSYYDGAQYDEDNEACQREWLTHARSGEKSLARSLFEEYQLPEHLRRHAYSTQIPKAVNWIADRLADSFAVQARPASVGEIVDACLSATPELAAGDGDEDRTVALVLREALKAGDVPVLIRWDAAEGRCWLEFWDSEQVDMRFTAGHPDAIESVAVRQLDWRDVDGQTRQVTLERRFTVDGDGTDRDCVERVYLVNEGEHWEENPVESRSWGVPFLPWGLVRAERASLRATRGASLITTQIMGTADRYNAVEQVAWLIARYNSHGNLAVVGDAAMMQSENTPIHKDVADVLRLPGGTGVEQISLSSDTSMIEHQKETLIDSMFERFGLVRTDQSTVSNLGQVSGYALEILNEQCLAYDTQVTMADGTTTIANDVQAGDHVVGYSGEPVVVQEVFRQRDEHVRVLETRQGRRTRVTGNHPLWTPTGWMHARDIEVGDSVTVGISLEHKRPPTMNWDRAWLLGLLIGDGFLAQRNGSGRKGGVKLTATDPEIVAYADEVVAREFGCRLSYYERYTYGIVKRDNKSGRTNPLVQWIADMDLLGRRAWDKIVPDEVLRGGPIVWRGFLSGYLDADGHAATTPHLKVQWSTVSLALACGIQTMAAYLGLNVSMAAQEKVGKPHVRINGRPVIPRHKTINLFIRDAAGFGIAANMLTPMGKKRHVFTDHTGKRLPNTYQLDQVTAAYWEEPTRIIGLTVEGGIHWTDGLITHNSDNTFSRIRAQLVKDFKKLFHTVIDAHQAWSSGTEPEPDTGEEETEQGQSVSLTAQSATDVTERTITIRLGSGWVVDEAAARDNYLAGAISRREFLRTLGKSEDQIDTIEDEIAAEKTETAETGEGTAPPVPPPNGTTQTGTTLNNTRTGRRPVGASR